MDLSPMRYKSYTWPHNPRVYSIDYERKMAVHKTPFGLFRLQDLGRTTESWRGRGICGPGRIQPVWAVGQYVLQRRSGTADPPAVAGGQRLFRVFAAGTRAPA